MTDKLTAGIKPVDKWITPTKHSGDTVGNTGLDHSGVDPEGSRGRITTDGSTRGKATGSHLVPDIPKAQKVAPIRTRPTPAANTSDPTRGK